MKVPDRFVHVGNRSLDECAAECGGDCNCVAYAYATLNSSAKSRGDVTRCLVWAGDGELVDTGRLGPGQVWGTVGAGGDSRETLYLRVAGMPNSGTGLKHHTSCYDKKRFRYTSAKCKYDPYAFHEIRREYHVQDSLK